MARRRGGQVGGVRRGTDDGDGASRGSAAKRVVVRGSEAGFLGRLGSSEGVKDVSLGLLEGEAIAVSGWC